MNTSYKVDDALNKLANASGVAILSEPYKCNRSDGRWAVRIRRTMDGGGTTEYSESFWKKVDARQFIERVGK